MRSTADAASPRAETAAGPDDDVILHPLIDQFLDALARWHFARALADDARGVDRAPAAAQPEPWAAREPLQRTRTNDRRQATRA